VAIVADARPDVERVRAMSRCIAHRGPDGEGVWLSPSGRACLAHRRLSIIDLATGAQPMVDDESGLALVFNGEIYNYRELRTALAADGARFTTTSDTEVLLRGLRARGAEVLQDLRGMFAFAAWDERRGELLLARDRVGKKPLYYVVDDGCLYFASTLRALRQSSARRWPVDPAMVERYLALGYVPAPETIYEGVHKLSAGSLLRVRVGGAPEVERYWDLADEPPPFTGSFDDAVDQLDSLLGEAVSLRLRSDVPLGVFLSGGIDSSLIAAMATRRGANPVLTFSIGMAGSRVDESTHAAAVARALNTEHRTFTATPDLLALAPQLGWHYGEPFADSSALPLWLLAQQTRQHVTVAVGGDGGDEGFAGYNWYDTAAALERVGRLVPTRALAMATRTVDGVLGGVATAGRTGRVRRGMAMLGTPGGGPRFAALRSFVSAGEARRLYDGALREAYDAPSAARHYLEAFYARAHGSPLRRMRYVDIESYLADGLMPKVDVATMAHGVEARAPLLDHEILRFALSLPDAYLHDEGGGKRPLRALLYRMLPRALFERPKQGFDLPLDEWLRGPLLPKLREMETRGRLADTGWFRPEAVRALVDEHASGARDHTQRLFSLWMLDEWLATA
jgi:asparagine synthase (glutamine-hydrolysing)